MDFGSKELSQLLSFLSKQTSKFGSESKAEMPIFSHRSVMSRVLDACRDKEVAEIVKQLEKMQRMEEQKLLLLNEELEEDFSYMSANTRRAHQTVLLNCRDNSQVERLKAMQQKELEVQKREHEKKKKELCEHSLKIWDELLLAQQMSLFNCGVVGFFVTKDSVHVQLQHLLMRTMLAYKTMIEPQLESPLDYQLILEITKLPSFQAILKLQNKK